MGYGTLVQTSKRMLVQVKRRWQAMERKERGLLWGALVFFAIGIVLVLAPQSAKRQRLREQNKLTEVILDGGASLEVRTNTGDAVIDFYEDDREAVDIFGSPPPLEEQIAALEDPAQPQSRKTEIKGLGVLEIDAIHLRLPVAEGVSKTTLKVSAGHVSETANIGAVGNAVVAAHRSYSKGQLFNRLDELALDDIVKYTSRDGVVFLFRVCEIQTLEPSDERVFDIYEGRSDLTLYTCTPVRVASHRLAVRTTLIETIRPQPIRQSSKLPQHWKNEPIRQSKKPKK